MYGDVDKDKQFEGGAERQIGKILIHMQAEGIVNDDSSLERERERG